MCPTEYYARLSCDVQMLCIKSPDLEPQCKDFAIFFIPAPLNSDSEKSNLLPGFLFCLKRTQILIHFQKMHILT